MYVCAHKKKGVVIFTAPTSSLHGFGLPRWPSTKNQIRVSFFTPGYLERKTPNIQKGKKGTIGLPIFSNKPCLVVRILRTCVGTNADGHDGLESPSYNRQT